MKNIIKFPALLLGLMILFTGTAQKAMAQDEEISLQSFYNDLSPYGTWTQDPEYGNVWSPNDVDQNDFRPYYSDGRWAMTEYGNTWVSDYDWGWAPFHYGRWIMNRYHRWVWIPDTVWGPAWVSWRSGGGYYGWAPLGPGINININIGGGYNIPNDWWVFIPQRNIYSNRYPRYSSRNVSIVNRTTIINNVHRRNNNSYYTGPRADEIKRITNKPVKIYDVSRASRPGRTSITNNSINIYNPRSGRSGTSQTGTPRQPVRSTSARGSVQPTQRPESGRTSQQRGQVRTSQTQQQTQQRQQQAQQQRESQQRQQQTQQRQQQAQQQRESQQRQQQAQQQQAQQQRESQQRQQQAQQQQAQQQRESQQRESQQRQQQQIQQRQQQSSPARSPASAPATPRTSRGGARN